MDEEDADTEEWVDPDRSPAGKVSDDIIDQVPHAKLVDSLVDLDGELDADAELLNDTISQQMHWNELRQNQNHIPRETEFWGPSQVSLPKDSIWGSPGSNSFDPAAPNDQKYTYNYDVADASDTYVYIIHDEGLWSSHSVSLNPPCASTIVTPV